MLQKNMNMFIIILILCVYYVLDMLFNSISCVFQANLALHQADSPLVSIKLYYVVFSL